MRQRFLVILPKVCYGMALLLFLLKSYFVVEFLQYGYFPELDMTRDVAPQVAKTFLEIFAQSFVWVVFGLLVSRQNKLELHLASGVVEAAE